MYISGHHASICHLLFWLFVICSLYWFIPIFKLEWTMHELMYEGAEGPSRKMLLNHNCATIFGWGTMDSALMQENLFAWHEFELSKTLRAISWNISAEHYMWIENRKPLRSARSSVIPLYGDFSMKINVKYVEATFAASVPSGHFWRFLTSWNVSGYRATRVIWKKNTHTHTFFWRIAAITTWKSRKFSYVQNNVNNKLQVSAWALPLFYLFIVIIFNLFIIIFIYHFIYVCAFVI